MGSSAQYIAGVFCLIPLKSGVESIYIIIHSLLRSFSTLSNSEPFCDFINKCLRSNKKLECFSILSGLDANRKYNCIYTTLHIHTYVGEYHDEDTSFRGGRCEPQFFANDFCNLLQPSDSRRFKQINSCKHVVYAFYLLFLQAYALQMVLNRPKHSHVYLFNSTCYRPIFRSHFHILLWVRKFCRFKFRLEDKPLLSQFK